MYSIQQFSLFVNSKVCRINYCGWLKDDDVVGIVVNCEVGIEVDGI